MGIIRFFFLDTKRIQSLGWKPKICIRDGVLKTVEYLKENEWVFERRYYNENLCQGLWHLGSVTAACLAYVGHDVVGLDDDLSNINNLKQGKAPLFEPGLDKMIDNAINKGHLRITKNSKDAISDAEVLWVTFDTPIDEDDQAM
ncbi:MAG: hypothetical protein CM1200mP16_12160 [Nitrospina sp.]|nr:MAG: hypothetical protein CM1200mP16_12160 [Nitrospina sp.]